LPKQGVLFVIGAPDTVKKFSNTPVVSAKAI